MTLRKMTKECDICGATPTHHDGVTYKAICCECWGDCNHFNNKQGEINDRSTNNSIKNMLH